MITRSQGHDVWICDLGVSGAQLAEIERTHGLLTAGETQRAAAMGDVANRAQWIAAHVALHLTLQSCVGARVEFTTNMRGAATKPSVVGWDGDFSLSHSGNLVLIAISNRGRTGIDVEVRRTTRIDARRRSMIIAAGRSVASAPLPASHGNDMHFLAAWTRLEALAKARGDGIGALFETLGFHATEASDATAAESARLLLGDGSDRLAVHDIDVGRLDAVAALAQPADADPPTIHEFAKELPRPLS